MDREDLLIKHLDRIATALEKLASKGIDANCSGVVYDRH